MLHSMVTQWDGNLIPNGRFFLMVYPVYPNNVYEKTSWLFHRIYHAHEITIIHSHCINSISPQTWGWFDVWLSHYYPIIIQSMVIDYIWFPIHTIPPLNSIPTSIVFHLSFKVMVSHHQIVSNIIIPFFSHYYPIKPRERNHRPRPLTPCCRCSSGSIQVSRRCCWWISVTKNGQIAGISATKLGGT